MGMENNALVFLRRYRYLILLLMVTASLVNAFVRFTGDWKHFWTVLLLQALFGQAVFAYLRGARIQVAPGGSLSKDANPLGRAGLAAFALTIYFLSFGYEGSKREESIFDKRPSDWTMPTRGEIGRTVE
jgi:hypothetical protein